ncbi:Heterokaryon incompatibility protein (HET) domain containing protein [Hyaloscypha variabilis]
MRLLNVHTKRLEEFFEKATPSYAILSHTWGEDEVTFREFDPILGPRRTSAKIEGCCAQALEDGYNYVWIDTCCIDKSSSAELSEAINSMFVWYEESNICYVYLSDVLSEELDSSNIHSEFSTSRWFTRGWTLQELLAPHTLEFYNALWHPLGILSKGSGGNTDLQSYLQTITEIPREFIMGEKTLNTASIAMRMSWASRRQTTRKEDMAYCLLGLFDIAMPMLYGEGSKAFMRLQEEILKNEDDLSIFAWGFGTNNRGEMSCLATSPADFAVPISYESSRFQWRASWRHDIRT